MPATIRPCAQVPHSAHGLCDLAVERVADAPGPLAATVE